MTSAKDGFRRAKATSWTLVGVGAAGVVGASLLAYSDTAEKQYQSNADDPPAALPATPPLATWQYPTTTTSVAPSYSPQIHTRSHGS